MSDSFKGPVVPPTMTPRRRRCPAWEGGKKGKVEQYKIIGKEVITY
jgi:hypothetical protein